MSKQVNSNYLHTQDDGCSTSHVTGELQIKTMTRCDYAPVGTARTRSAKSTRCRRGRAAAGALLIHRPWTCETARPLRTTVQGLLTQPSVSPRDDAACALLGIPPKKLKTSVHIHTKNLHLDVSSSFIPNCQNSEPSHHSNAKGVATPLLFRSKRSDTMRSKVHQAQVGSR